MGELGVKGATKLNKLYYHLPGLFEFYDLYKEFLKLFKEHREYFYEWCEIGSIYGAPANCLWGGGRVGFGDCDIRDVLTLLKEYRISGRLTFSNSLLCEEHLKDSECNRLCELFSDSIDEKKGIYNGVIVHSELLLDYLKERYPSLYAVSSTTKVLTNFNDFKAELKREEFKYVVPDFRLNKALSELGGLQQTLKDKVEFLCNECCDFECSNRKKCYENVSLKSLGEIAGDFRCTSKAGSKGYMFSRAMTNKGFIGIDDILTTYLPMGFTNYKLEGRGLGSAVVFEMLLYYMTKPEYQLIVRENIYLDSMLDLF